MVQGMSGCNVQSISDTQGTQESVLISETPILVHMYTLKVAKIVVFSNREILL